MSDPESNGAPPPNSAEKPKRDRNWCFTINNYAANEAEEKPDDQDVLRTLVPADASYIVWGREVGDEGTPHLQGYVKTVNPVSLKKLKKLGFARAHLEPMQGTHRAAIDYCKKDGDWEEFGEQPCQGYRSDLVGFKHRLDHGEQPVQVAESDEHFATYVKYHAGMDKYAHHLRAKRIRTDRTMPKVYIRVGEAGSGKTRWLDEQFGVDGWARMPNPTGSWFITPTVSDSDTVLIDDVGPSKVPKVEEFLEWTDRYPIEFNSKGSHLWWKPKNIVFTSNCPPSEWWPKITDAHKAAVERRIYRIDLVYKDQPEEHIYPNGE